MCGFWVMRLKQRLCCMQGWTSSMIVKFADSRKTKLLKRLDQFIRQSAASTAGAFDSIHAHWTLHNNAVLCTMLIGIICVIISRQPWGRLRTRLRLSVCLCVIKLFKEDSSKTTWWTFTKFVADTDYIIPGKWLLFGADDVQRGRFLSKDWILMDRGLCI